MKISKDFLRGLGMGLLISAIIVALLGPVFNPKTTQSAQTDGVEDQIASDAGPGTDKVSANDNSTGLTGNSATDQNPAATPPQTQTSATQTPAAPQPTEVEFYIPEGETAQQISQILLEKGLIQDKDAFTQLILSRGGASNLARGTFKMPLGLTMNEIADRLIIK